MDDRLLAFIGVSVAVVVIPGPDMALVARNVLRHGRSAGFATSVGICTGILGWAVAAALGVSTLLATSATAFTVAQAGWGRVPDLPRDHDAARQRCAGRRRRAWRAGGCRGIGRGCRACCRPCSTRSSASSSSRCCPSSSRPAICRPCRRFSWRFSSTSSGLAGSWRTTMLGAVGGALNRPRPRRFIRWLSGTILIALGARVALERA